MKHLLANVSLFLLSGCAVSGWLSKDSPLGGYEVEGIASRVARDGMAPNGVVDHFAVLIGANTELRHRGNLSMAYQVLIEQGYRAENVYILDSEGEAVFFPTTDRTTRETMQSLFEHLRDIVEPQDTLFIYVTGHGRRVT